MNRGLLTLIVAMSAVFLGCSSSPDPHESYCLGWATPMDPFESRDLINSSIEMMKQNPDTPLSVVNLTYKDWVDFHELMLSGEISLDESKRISELLSGICGEVLK